MKTGQPREKVQAILGLRTGVQDVLKAHIECGIGVRGESVSILPYDVLGLSVFVADSVLDLQWNSN